MPFRYIGRLILPTIVCEAHAEAILLLASSRDGRRPSASTWDREAYSQRQKGLLGHVSPPQQKSGRWTVYKSTQKATLELHGNPLLFLQASRGLPLSIDADYSVDISQH